MVDPLVLTYHAVQAGRSPLCVDPELFAEQLDRVADSRARIVTVRELVDVLRAGPPQERLVAITFDDGFASVPRTAAPLLLERGMTATVFCVAGRLGGRSDWPSARGTGFAAPLATGQELAELASLGFEIGSHGFDHAPLVGGSDALLEREVVASRRALEEAAGSRVTAFAFPYGAFGSQAAPLVERTYDAACTTRVGRVRRAADVYSLPRVDVHYVRRPEVLGRALSGGLDPYLRLRDLAARARRAFRPDYRPAVEHATR